MIHSRIKAGPTLTEAEIIIQTHLTGKKEGKEPRMEESSCIRIKEKVAPVN